MTFDTAIARIACAQICRSCGIDRCSPTALESLGDILGRFLTLLATTAMQAAHVKSSETCSLEDALFAMENLHILPKHIDNADCEGIIEFLDWLKGPAPQRALQVSRMQQQTLSALGAAQGAAIAAQQGSNEMQGSNARQLDDHADWLRQMVNKQILMGHDQKYKNTIFGEMPETAGEISGQEFMSDELAKVLGVQVPDYHSKAVEEHLEEPENHDAMDLEKESPGSNEPPHQPQPQPEPVGQ